MGGPLVREVYLPHGGSSRCRDFGFSTRASACPWRLCLRVAMAGLRSQRLSLNMRHRRSPLLADLKSAVSSAEPIWQAGFRFRSRGESDRNTPGEASASGVYGGFRSFCRPPPDLMLVRPP